MKEFKNKDGIYLDIKDAEAKEAEAKVKKWLQKIKVIKLEH